MENRQENYFEWNDKNQMEMLECLKCKNWNYRKGSRCRAFPDGIPISILSFSINHHKPYKGDNGIQFEPIKEGE
jgi:hypothetical protein